MAGRGERGDVPVTNLKGMVTRSSSSDMLAVVLVGGCVGRSKVADGACDCAVEERQRESSWMMKSRCAGNTHARGPCAPPSRCPPLELSGNNSSPLTALHPFHPFCAHHFATSYHAVHPLPRGQHAAPASGRRLPAPAIPRGAIAPLPANHQDPAFNGEDSAVTSDAEDAHARARKSFLPPCKSTAKAQS